jgi:hypothetical protein
VDAGGVRLQVHLHAFSHAPMPAQQKVPIARSDRRLTYCMTSGP